MKKRVAIIQNEKGSISMYFIIFMVFFLPFALWIGVHLPLKFEATQEVKQMVSNTADSMISRLDDEALSRGIVWIDPTEAEDVARRMIKETMNLDEEWRPQSNALLKGPEPIIFEFYHITDFSSLEDIFGKPNENGEYVLPLKTGVYVYVLNGSVVTDYQVHFKGILPIDKPTAIVRANLPLKNFGWLGNDAVIHKTGVAEAEMYVREES